MSNKDRKIGPDGMTPFGRSRRRFLFISTPGAALSLAGVLSAFSIACETQELELVTRKDTEQLVSKPLIPSEFSEKKALDIIEDEIFPRVGVIVPIQGRSIYPYISVDLQSTDGSYEINADFTGFHEIDVIIRQQATGNVYRLRLTGSDKVTVVSGETATKQEGEKLYQGLSSFLITNFNQAIKEGKTADVTRFYYTVKPTVTPTPPSSE